MNEYPVESKDKESMTGVNEILLQNSSLSKSIEEKILETGQKANSRELGAGVNKNFFIDIVDDGAAIFKPASGEKKSRDKIAPGTYYKRERAAYLASEMLGFGFVPATVIREVDGEIGSMQQFVKDAMLLYEGKAHVNDDELIRMWIFDLIVRNSDRHGGNAIVENGKVIPIDHGLCFSEDDVCLWRDFSGIEVPEDLIKNLQRFSESENDRKFLRQLLGELLLEDEANSFFERLGKITQILSEKKQISEDDIELIIKGGERVWFNNEEESESEPALWIN